MRLPIIHDEVSNRFTHLTVPLICMAAMIKVVIMLPGHSPVIIDLPTD